MPQFSSCHPSRFNLQQVWLLLFTFLYFVAGTGMAQAGTPGVSLSLSPSTIGPGSTSTLTYTIDNTANDTAVTGVSFANTLPTGVTVASPVRASDSCSGLVTASAGGTSINYSLERLSLGVSCSISVDITSSTVGVHTITTGDLTSSEGNSGTATGDLTVDSARPGFSIAVSPATISPNSVSTLTYTIDNSLNGANAQFLFFTTNLPSGMEISAQPNTSSNCASPGFFTANAGSNSINVQFITANAGQTCTLSVDITAESVGQYDIYSGELFSQFTGTLLSRGYTQLSVERSLVDITFPASVTPGSSATLTFDIINNNRDQDITGLAFTDDLNAALSGLTATALPATGFCGAGSTISGTSSLSIAGVNLISGESCSFDVTVLIPANAAAGSYTNTTSSINYNLAGSPTTSAAASNAISVYNALDLEVTFLNNTAALGEDVTLRYIITNTDTANSASAITYSHPVGAPIPGLVIKTLPAANSCGSGSVFTQNVVNDAINFSVGNASLAAGANCTFDLVMTLPDSAAPGNYTYTTGAISGTVAGQSLTGNTATDVLSVLGAPILQLSLSSNAALPGDSVTATFTLNYSPNAASDATGVGFTLDLDSALSGLVSNSGPKVDICGTGSSFSGTSALTFSGGTLAPGDSCSFSVNLPIPASAPSGTITLTSSSVDALVSSTAVTSGTVSTNLLISGLTATKTFVTNPVLPGSNTILRYTLSNSANAGAATAIAFTDNFTQVISNMAATGLPTTPCGVSSSLSGTTTISLSNAELLPGDSCIFDVPISVPANAALGSYISTTSAITATVGGSGVVAGTASTSLTVEDLSVIISTTASNPTSTSPIPVVINFSRDVVNFESTDLVVGNGSVSNFAGSGNSYTADIVPAADGTVTVDLPSNAVDDAVDNTVKNPAATQLSLTYSSTPEVIDPSLVISSPSASATASSSVTYTVTYSDVSSVDLTTTAISLNKTGTANASITVTDGETTTPTVTLSNITGDGTLGISIASGTARNVTKVAGSAGPSTTFSVDNTQPTVAITSSLTSARFNNASFTATFTFSESVTGFTVSDITAANATLSNFSAVSGSVYTATVTPVANGQVTLDVAAGKAEDAVGNSNTGATQFSAVYDTVSPSVVISSDITGSATNGAFVATFTFNEDVTGFTVADVSAGNATLSGFAATNAAVYTVTVTPVSNGTVTLNIAAGAAQDLAGNNSSAATQFSTTYDVTAPNVVIASNISGTATNSPFTATFTFNEDVSGFTVGDISASNASLSSFTVSSAKVYTVVVSPTTNGAVTLNVAAGVAQDNAGNNNTSATQFATLYDTNSPTLAITSNITGAITNAAFTATFTFNEDVTGFAVSDINATNANLTNFVASSATVYSATVTPINDGAVSLNVATAVAQDVAGNSNVAATPFATTYDASAPTVSITSDVTDSLTNSAFTATFTFSEAVSGFSAGDVIANNASVSNFNATSTSVFTATITPTSDGAVSLDFPANVAQDVAGNANTAASTFNVTYDGSAPQLTASSPTHDAVDVDNARLQVSLTFNEAIQVSGGSIALVKLADSSVLETLSLLGSSVTINNTSVTAQFASTLAQNERYGIVINSGDITDNAGNTWSGLAIGDLTFTASNQPPGNNDDSASVAEDSQVVINVLDNDEDLSDGIDVTSVQVETQPLNGTVTVNTQTGAITYTPAANFNGLDSFTYIVADNQGSFSEAANVAVSITPVNDLPTALNDTANTTEELPVTIAVLNNDSDVDVGSNLAPNEINPNTVSIVDQVSSGTLVVVDAAMVVADSSLQVGQVIYTPDANFFGIDTFTYTVADSTGAVSTTATVTINVGEVNDAPVANDDSSTTQEDQSVIINVLSNDTDSDGQIDTQSVVVVSQGVVGSAVVNTNSGEITYTPNTNRFGVDTFTYTVQDSSGLVSNSATVTVEITSVNDAPVAANDSFTVSNEGSTLLNILANDTDPDSEFEPTNTVDPTSISIVTPPTFGSVSIDAATGYISYTPTTPVTETSDSFSYVITDTQGETSNTAIVQLTLQAPTDGLVANDDSVQATEDTSITIDILSNDGDFSHSLDVASVVIVQNTSNGSTTINTDGSVTYVPSANFFGTDTFTYTVSDTQSSLSNVATVSINVLSVNDAPVALNDEGSAAAGQEIILDVLANDSDIDGDELIISSATATQGVVTIVDGRLSYTAPTNFTGNVTINYTIDDGAGLTAAAQVSVVVSNDGGTGSGISLQVPADVEVNATGLVTRVALGNAQATDSGGDPVPVSLLATPFFRPGVHSVLWQATLGSDVVQGAQQVIVNPMVNIEKAQRVEEGQVALIDVVLNGDAPVYPIMIPYTVAGTSDSADHNLTSGTLIIESGTKATLQVETRVDNVAEGDETLIVTLDSTLNSDNAVHTLTISDDAVVPDVQLLAQQDGVYVTTIYSDSGLVDVELQLNNKALADIQSIDWSASSNELNSLNIATSSTLFSFAPESLASGVYHVKATVTDVNGLVGYADLTIRVLTQIPELTSSDSDADGIADEQEGLGDDDGDGIANYLDALDDCNIQPLSLSNTAGYLIEGDIGACLTLGDAAFSNAESLVIPSSSLPTDEGMTAVGVVVDFVVRGLQELGQTYRVVIPQREIIPADAQYRKYFAAQETWTDFTVAGADAVHSAPGEPGVCPPPGDASWTDGLTEGHWCVRLTISDGGPNDDDGVANGIIVDPSGLAIVASANQRPVAADDDLRVVVREPVAIDVLANDSDADNDTLIIVSANAYLGTAEIVNNELIYTAPNTFTGSDVVLYAVSDGNGGTASATALIAVADNSPPQVQDDTAQTDSNTAITVNVLANDTDADGDELVIVEATATPGSVEIQDGSLIYTPASGVVGTVTVTYTVTDGFTQASATLTVTVTEPPSSGGKSGGGSMSLWLLVLLLGSLGYKFYAGFQVNDFRKSTMRFMHWERK